MELMDFLEKENAIQPKEENELVSLTNQVLAFEDALAEAKKIEENLKTAKEKLKEAMIKNQVTRWEMPNGTKLALVEDIPDEEKNVTYVDVDQFLEENAELHNLYVETRNKYKKTKLETIKGRKGYVRITLKKDKENVNE